MWKLNSTLLNHEVKKLKRKKERRCFEMNENENNIPKLMGFSETNTQGSTLFVNAYVILKNRSQINNPD